jgi:hypothetical protein
MAAQIEGRQSSNRRDLDSFTLQEIMRASLQRIGGIHLTSRSPDERRR